MRAQRDKVSTAFVAAARELLNEPAVKRKNGSLSPSTASFEVCLAACAALKKHGLVADMRSQRLLIQLCVSLTPVETAIGTVIRFV